MSRTPEEQQAWEQQCYGCTEQELRASLAESISVKMYHEQKKHWREPPSEQDHAQCYGMIAMSHLSDAQELMERADESLSILDRARQEVNVAKFVISRFLMEREDAPSGRLNGKRLAQAMADMVNSGRDVEARAFAEELTMRTHNTLQQSAFGVMLHAIHAWSECQYYDARNEATVQACKKIVADNPDLFFKRHDGRVSVCLPLI